MAGHEDKSGKETRQKFPAAVSNNVPMSILSSECCISVFIDQKWKKQKENNKHPQQFSSYFCSFQPYQF
jgi:hypothetical protein